MIGVHEIVNPEPISSQFDFTPITDFETTELVKQYNMGFSLKMGNIPLDVGYGQPYSSGSRNELITVTVSDGLLNKNNDLTDKDPNKLVNGSIAKEVSFVDGASSGHFRFEFNEQVIINGVRLKQQVGQDVGLWVVYGSNDPDTGYVRLSNTAPLGIPATSEISFDNQNAYKYYRLELAGGLVSGNYFIYEFEFSGGDFKDGYIKHQRESVITTDLQQIDLSAVASIAGLVIDEKKPSYTNVEYLVMK